MLSPESNWYHASEGFVSSNEMIEFAKAHVDKGLSLHVGSDSMLYSNYCIFSCVVAVHSNKLNIANYFYQKQKKCDRRYKNLEHKIMKEVELSIATANYIKNKIPHAEIEIHADIGDQEKNATRFFVDSARGWATGMGYHFKIKPDSWASSVADWHTK